VFVAEVKQAWRRQYAGIVRVVGDLNAADTRMKAAAELLSSHISVVGFR
jgi:hypothetical protein